MHYVSAATITYRQSLSPPAYHVSIDSLEFRRHSAPAPMRPTSKVHAHKRSQKLAHTSAVHTVTSRRAPYVSLMLSKKPFLPTQSQLTTTAAAPRGTLQGIC